MVPSPKLSKLESIPGDDTLANTGNPAADDPNVRIDSIEGFKKQLESAAQFRARNHRPFITVSYAQSIDGSIASRQNKPIALSGPESWQLTHQIRAACDSILVGIGTVLTDNPQLSVRKVDGKNPQPIILDTHLRTPLNAKCVLREDLSSWLINGGADPFGKIQALENAGAKPLACETGTDGKIDLFALMGLLADRKINSVMVEGGARVITSFVNSKLVDQLIITIAPKMVGGLPVLNSRALDGAPYFNCERVHYQQLGKDIIVWARPEWKTA